MSVTRDTIIIVDDNLTNLTVAKKMLKTFYQVIPASSAAALFETLETVTPNLILLDIEMPEMDGYETIKILKADSRWKDIPVFFLSVRDDSESEVEGFDQGASDYVTKPFSAPILLKRIEKELLIVKQKQELLDSQSELQYHLENLVNLVETKAETVNKMQNAVFNTVIDMVEFRDKYTGGHIARTGQYLKALLEEMQKKDVYTDIISEWDMVTVLTAAKLYDIGKIAVSDTLLGKTAKFTDDEFEHMKSHVTAGVDAIERIVKKVGDEDFFNHAIKMAGTHHENWDGSGYPIGLREQNIPLEGRLLAIAGAYDALISERYHKDALSHEKACEIIEEGSGKQFDPALVKVFLGIKDQFVRISEETEA